MNDIAGECADALMALINSRPSSPRRDEIVDLMRPLLDKAVRSAIDEHQVNQSGALSIPDTGGATYIMFSANSGTYVVTDASGTAVTPTF